MLYKKSGILSPTGLGIRSRLVCVGREHPCKEYLVTEKNLNWSQKKQMRE
jgi:hypothetical protein